MPSIITRGGMSAKALGFGASSSQAVYVEDVFSTYLYSGNSSTQTITNGIDLSTKGGLVWTKCRSTATDHELTDTIRKISASPAGLSSNTTSAQGFSDIVGFTTSGFNLDYITGLSNISGRTYASWTFAKQAKFFDIVTYTGNGTSNFQYQTISHNLGCVPGLVIVKPTSGTGNWSVYFYDGSFGAWLRLNTTTGDTGNDTITNLTSTTFDVNTFVSGVYTADSCNTNGVQYVAYLFARSNSGGFGAAGTDSVVACGSFTTDGSGNIGSVTLGWEPQIILFKATNVTQDWFIFDTMRGLSNNDQVFLQPNSSGAEGAYSTSQYIYPTATGFAGSGNFFGPSKTLIYMAIRRGPMKTPTDATKVFSPIARAGTSSVTTVTSGFVTDAILAGPRNISNQGISNWDRLRGYGYYLGTAYTSAEQYVASTVNSFAAMTGYGVGAEPVGVINYTNGSWNYINYAFKRAPGFFDVVCYSGGQSSYSHNLGVKPELMFIKVRSTSGRNWVAAYGVNIGGYLNTSQAINASNAFINLNDATSTTFPSNGNPEVGQSGQTYVAYLFASAAGVSKVGSYTGTGSAQNIDCGFSSSARFVLIKRIDNSGDWYVYDSARGISSGNDPYLLLDTTASEVTGTNYVDAYATGFSVTSSAPSDLNANGGTYLFLAIA